MKRYSAVIVDDDPVFRETLMENMRASQFDAVGYDAVEQLLHVMFGSSLHPRKHPDLIVIDVQLEKGRMQGLDLFAELARRNVTSEVMGITGHDLNPSIEQAMRMGAAAIVAKTSVTSQEALSQMEYLAKIGMKRRAGALNGQQKKLDPSRQSRPVFLSYSHKDQKFATGIRRTIEARNIGVWYDRTSLKLGDDTRQEIEQGIEQSIIFIALMTDHYVESEPCIHELDQFLTRKALRPPSELLFLGIIDKLSYRYRSVGKLAPVISRYQCADVSVSNMFVEEMTNLLTHVKDRTAQERKQQKVRAISAA